MKVCIRTRDSMFMMKEEKKEDKRERGEREKREPQAQERVRRAHSARESFQLRSKLTERRATKQGIHILSSFRENNSFWVYYFCKFDCLSSQVAEMISSTVLWYGWPVYIIQQLQNRTKTQAKTSQRKVNNKLSLSKQANNRLIKPHLRNHLPPPLTI